MTVPVRTLALGLAQPTRRGWLGLSLSILCFGHCVGAAALVPLLPAAFSFLTENEVVEWGLLAVSAVLAGRLVWMERARLRRWGAAPLVGWAALTTLGVVSLALESESLLQGALALLALLQLSVLIGRRRSCPY